jgi:hypothetical protein
MSVAPPPAETLPLRRASDGGARLNAPALPAGATGAEKENIRRTRGDGCETAIVLLMFFLLWIIRFASPAAAAAP